MCLSGASQQKLPSILVRNSIQRNAPQACN
jgi:hypothetical protein